MNDQLAECYRLLGLRRGASSAELKAAHRDLAKVWHPDRFNHDPRLQQKAQEKLKEINEAYAQLRSGKGRRQTPPASTRERHGYSQKVKVSMAPRIRWQFILAPVLIFAVAFLVTSRSLLQTAGGEGQGRIPAIAQSPNSPNPERQQDGSRGNNSANEPQGKDRFEANSPREESSDASTSQPSVASPAPLHTVTIVIDPTTGLIARAGCPTKSTMTYPGGNEPKQYCSSHRTAPIPPLEVLSPSESRLKSAAKRLASPAKWFAGKPKPDAASKPDPKSP